MKTIDALSSSEQPVFTPVSYRKEDFKDFLSYAVSKWSTWPKRYDLETEAVLLALMNDHGLTRENLLAAEKKTRQMDEYRTWPPSPQQWIALMLDGDSEWLSVADAFEVFQSALNKVKWIPTEAGHYLPRYPALDSDVWGDCGACSRAIHAAAVLIGGRAGKLSNTALKIAFSTEYKRLKKQGIPDVSHLLPSAPESRRGMVSDKARYESGVAGLRAALKGAA